MSKNNKKITVKLIKSLNKRVKSQKACAHGLGLRKINQVVEVEATPEILGMVNKISFMLEVNEEI